MSMVLHHKIPVVLEVTTITDTLDHEAVQAAIDREIVDANKKLLMRMYSTKITKTESASPTGLKDMSDAIEMLMTFLELYELDKSDFECNKETLAMARLTKREVKAFLKKNGLKINGV